MWDESVLGEEIQVEVLAVQAGFLVSPQGWVVAARGKSGGFTRLKAVVEVIIYTVGTWWNILHIVLLLTLKRAESHLRCLIQHNVEDPDRWLGGLPTAMVSHWAAGRQTCWQA